MSEPRYIPYSYFHRPVRRGLVIAPRYNSLDTSTPDPDDRKPDATGAFHIGARAFSAHHRFAAPVLFDNTGNHQQIRSAVLDIIRNASGPLDVLAYFGHGMPNGLSSAKIYVRQLDELTAALRPVLATNATIILYACSAGIFVNGFAAQLAQRLNGVQVFGHATSMHSFYNPFKTRHPAGEWVVDPCDTINFRRWSVRLTTTNLWARYPFMTADELGRDLTLAHVAGGGRAAIGRQAACR